MTTETVDGCCNEAADCDDGDPATTDVCEPTTHVCKNLNLGCADNADCNDSNACTTDLCKEDGTCTHDTIEGCCTTGDQCDPGKVCQGGVCVEEQEPEPEEDDSSSGCGAATRPSAPAGWPMLLLALLGLAFVPRRRSRVR